MLDIMSSMLYNGFIMNAKTNLPEELIPGPNYSVRANLKANKWAFVAMILAWAGDLCLVRHKEWTAASCSAITLIPILVSMLWVWDFARWTRGMDELHRRLTLEAGLFGTGATLLVVTIWHLLEQTGLFEAWEVPALLHLHAHFRTASFPISLLLGFYFLGYVILKRRYQ